MWAQIYSSAPAAMMNRGGTARPEAETAPARSRRLYLGPVSPNPVGVQLTLRYEIPSRQEVSIGLYDVAGRQIRAHEGMELDPGEYQSVMDLSGVPSGMYYCTLRAGERVLHQRFVHVQ